MLRSVFVALSATMFCVLALSTVANAKVVEGEIRNTKDSFTFLSKFPFDIGQGELKMYAEYTDGKGPRRVMANLYLDEEWPTVMARLAEQGDNTQERCKNRVQLYSTSPVINTNSLKWDIAKSRTIEQHVRPHIWYVALDNCYQEEFSMKWKLEFTNPGDSHFGYDEKGMLFLHFLMLVAFCTFGGFVAHQVDLIHLSAPKMHPVVKVLICLLGIQYVSILCEFAHLFRYWYNGYGIGFLDTFSEVFHVAAELLCAALLISMAWGYTIDYDKLPMRQKVLPAFGVLAFVHLILVFWSRSDDSHYKHHDRETVAGYALYFIRLALFVVFVAGLNKTFFKNPPGGDMKQFYLQFTVLASVWFLAYPLIVLFVAPLFAEYLRHTLIVTGGVVLQSAALLGLARLFLTRGKFFKNSTLSDVLLPGLSAKPE